MTALVRHHFQFAVPLLLVAAAIISMVVWRSSANIWFMETSRDAGLVLSSLKVSGTSRTSDHDLQAVLDIDNGMPLLAIDLDNLQARIEALPWVKQAIINRQLPGELVIDVTEREPYALVQSAGRLALVDSEGVRITEQGLSAFRHLPLLVGDLAATDYGTFEQLMAEQPTLAARVKSAVRVGGRRWDIIFDNGVRVKLPAEHLTDYNAALAWRKFADIERRQQLLAREISVIDLRQPDRLIVRVTPLGRRKMTGKEMAL